MATDDPSAPPDAAVAPGYLTNHAAQIFNRLADDALRPHGLSLALLGPLLLLSWKGPMLQRDIVRHSAIRQPAIAALLDKLEAMALIDRERLAQDRRAAIVRLTQSGAQTARIGGQVLVDLNASGTTGFSSQEAALLVKLMQRYIDNLVAAGTKHHE